MQRIRATDGERAIRARDVTQPTGSDGTSWCLYVPAGVCGALFTGLGPLIERARAVASLSIVDEPSADNLDFLRHCIDPATPCPQIYLEELRGGSSASVSYWVGEQVRLVLEKLLKG